jgi:hypothetical protein
MIDKYISVQDMLFICLIVGSILKVFQFYKEGKFKRK